MNSKDQFFITACLRLYIETICKEEFKKLAGQEVTKSQLINTIKQRLLNDSQELIVNELNKIISEIAKKETP